MYEYIQRLLLEKNGAGFHELAFAFTIRGYNSDHTITFRDIFERIFENSLGIVFCLQFNFMGIENRAVCFMPYLIQSLDYKLHPSSDFFSIFTRKRIRTK